MKLAGIRVGVFGMQRSGQACAAFLTRRQAEVVIFDQRSPEQLAEAAAALAQLGVKVRCAVQSWDELAAPQVLVTSPGVPVDHPILEQARAQGAEVIGEIELAYRFCRAPIAAFTGTNGKGTVTTLLGAMLQAGGIRHVVAGNIGLPLISVVEGDYELIVAEISSFQLETVDLFHPWVAGLINISPDHLDRHGTMEAYLAAKKRLFANQEASDCAVLNMDDTGVAPLAEELTARILGVSAHSADGAGWCEGDRLMVHLPGEEPLCVGRRSDLALPGEHNTRNALMAGLVAAACGCPPERMREAMRGYSPAPHLMTTVGTVGGVRFIDDSKATNPAAAVADISGIEGPVVVIAGGQAKGADLREFADTLVKKAKAAFLIGEAAQMIAGHVGERIPTVLSPSLEAAVAAAYAATVPGGTVILAPACASFDQFQGQAERGERFAAAVHRLAGAEPPGNHGEQVS